MPFVPRPPSTLPEPGTIHAHLALGDKRGSGRSSIVHNVEFAPAQILPGHLPPLVLKIGRSNRRAEIAYEAWFYDELECLQGVVLPRCYGWFEAELSKGQTFGAWSQASENRLESEESEYEEGFTGLLGEMSQSRNYVSVFLLEKLGEPLPFDEYQAVELSEDVV